MKYLLPFIITIVFFSCKSTSKTATENNTITEKYWKLIELYGNPVIVDSTMQREPHIIFRNTENRFNGNTGCNSMSGTYELLDMDRIKLSKIITTKMACMNTMELERHFTTVLQEADNYNVTGDTLVLNKAKMAPLARFKSIYLK